MSNRTYSTTPAVREDHEIRTLRWLAKHDSGTAGEIARDGARHSMEQIGRALDRMRTKGEVERADRGWRITDAGKARLATIQRPSLPVLPEPLLMHKSFNCTRHNTMLSVAHCAARYRTRGDDACGKNERGEYDRAGCPVGRQALAASEKRAA